MRDQIGPEKAFVVTGPTSGIGRHAALELSKYGTLVLVGRNREKLEALRNELRANGRRAMCVLCDLAEPASVQRAAAEIVDLQLPIAGLLNNAGIMQIRASKNTVGWDMTFATDHLGPFALSEALMPHLADGANVVFVASGVEDPARKPAVAAGFRGARYISAEASARGEWKAGGSKIAGGDAYATSKQCTLVTALAFARENPRLRINALEPGFIANTGLGRDANALLRFVMHNVLPLLAPRMKYWSTPERAGRIATTVVLNGSNATGVYFDDNGDPMLASELARDPAFGDRVVAETRALLASGP